MSIIDFKRDARGLYLTSDISFLEFHKKFRCLLIYKVVRRMLCCYFNSGRVLCITTEMFILVESCYSYAQRKRVGIDKL